MSHSIYFCRNFAVQTLARKFKYLKENIFGAKIQVFFGVKIQIREEKLDFFFQIFERAEICLKAKFCKN